MSLNKKIIKHPFFLILMILIGVISCRNANKEGPFTGRTTGGTVYGIKLSQPSLNRIVVPTANSDLELSNLQPLFVVHYNELAVSQSIESKAQQTEDGILLRIYQSSWESPWYANTKFQFSTGLGNAMEKKYLEVSFDFIYGPNRRIDLQKTQGEMAVSQMEYLIKSTLSHLFIMGG